MTTDLDLTFEARLIATDDGVTAAHVRVVIEDEDWNEDVYEYGASSKCDPADSFDPKVGFQLALGRALEKVGRQIKADGNRTVKREDERKKKQKAASEAATAARQKRSKEIRKSLKTKKGKKGKNKKG